MRCAMVASSSRTASSSSAVIFERRRSRLRRRSTARPRRKLSAAISVPTAVSMNTGATASWVTEVISGRWLSSAISALGPGAVGVAPAALQLDRRQPAQDEFDRGFADRRQRLVHALERVAVGGVEVLDLDGLGAVGELAQQRQ